MQEKDAIVLLVDDDTDDRYIAEEAFTEVGLQARLLFLNDGVELLDYLNRRGEFSDPKASPVPNVILLDINMPRMNGMEALEKLKTDPATRAIPVVMLTNSGDPHVVKECYQMGASSYIRKPFQFEDLVKSLGSIRKYWLETVTYPENR